MKLDTEVPFDLARDKSLSPDVAVVLAALFADSDSFSAGEW